MFVHVKVVADAKQDLVMEEGGYAYTVYVRASRERNEANEKLIDVVAAYFEVPQRDIRIVTGHKNRSKILEIKERTP